MEKQLKGITIISLVGSQGSGKSTLGSHLADYLGTSHLEISNIVKSMQDFPIHRDDLWQTGAFTKDNPNWLGEEVTKRIHKFLPKGKKTIVISGTREIEVHKYLRREGARLHIFEIAANATLRFKRLQHLGKVRDARHFLDKELREQKLGLPAVKKQAKHHVETIDAVSPEKVAVLMAQTLIKRGVKCN